MPFLRLVDSSVCFRPSELLVSIFNIPSVQPSTYLINLRWTRPRIQMPKAPWHMPAMLKITFVSNKRKTATQSNTAVRASRRTRVPIISRLISLRNGPEFNSAETWDFGRPLGEVCHCAKLDEFFRSRFLKPQTRGSSYALLSALEPSHLKTRKIIPAWMIHISLPTRGFRNDC